jgi:hypothetical protein
MRYLGRPVLALAAAFTITLAMESATAVAQPTDGALFQYMVGNLAANQHVSILFTSRVQGGVGDAETLTGSIGNLTFGIADFRVSSVGATPLSGIFDQSLLVEGQTVTGTATVPTGSLLTLKNRLTGKMLILRGDGKFSMPTGISPPMVKNVTCEGNSTACEATVPIPVGTHNRKLVIKLSHPNLQLESIAASPGSSKQYLGQTKNSQLVFKFGRPTSRVAKRALDRSSTRGRVELTPATDRRDHSTRGES